MHVSGVWVRACSLHCRDEKRRKIATQYILEFVFGLGFDLSGERAVVLFYFLLRVGFDLYGGLISNVYVVLLNSRGLFLI